MERSRYNQLVDVYSYSMCLVEVLDRHLPWTGCGNAGVVPLKVARGERPEGQLREADRAGSGREGVAQLARDCWAHEPRDRPSFAEVMERVERMQVELQVELVANGGAE